MSSPPNVDPEAGIDYIASQTIGECFYDSLQNILMFADVFRPIFASLANAIVQRGDGRALMNRDPRLVAEVAELLGTSGTTEFARFIVSAMRRYVLIKYLEAGLSEADVEGWFGPVQSTCAIYNVNEPTINRTNRESEKLFGRRKSINRLAGVRTAMNTARTIKIGNTQARARYYQPSGASLDPEKPAPGTFRPLMRFFEIALNTLPLFKGIFIQRFTTEHTFGHKTPFNFNTYSIPSKAAWYLSTTANTRNRRVIAVNYMLNSLVEAHSVAIIRYKGDYYFCDNVLGRAYKFHDKDKVIEHLGDRMTMNRYYHQRLDSRGSIDLHKLYKTEIFIGRFLAPTLFKSERYDGTGITIINDEYIASLPELLTKHERDVWTDASGARNYIMRDDYETREIAVIQESCVSAMCRRTRGRNKRFASAASSSSATIPYFPNSASSTTSNRTTTRRRTSLSRKQPQNRLKSVLAAPNGAGLSTA